MMSKKERVALMVHGKTRPLSGEVPFGSHPPKVWKNRNGITMSILSRVKSSKR